MYEGLISPDKLIAVVGVSEDPNKYGSRVYRTLKDYGYMVVPVNPKHEKLYGDKVYPNLSSLPQKPYLVNLIVPPKISIQIVIQAHELGIDKIWMQPGADSEEAIKFCHDNKMQCITKACIIIDGLQKSFLY